MSQFWSCSGRSALSLYFRNLAACPSSVGFYCEHSSLRDISSAAARDPDFDPSIAQTLPSQKIQKIADEISTLSMAEATDLSNLLKKILGLSAGMRMMPMGMMPLGTGMPGAGSAILTVEEKKPEKTSFDVKLERFDAASKIRIIKEVRTFTALGLKEAKELVEKTPIVLKDGVSKEEAEQIIEKLKTVGAKVIME